MGPWATCWYAQILNPPSVEGDSPPASLAMDLSRIGAKWVVQGPMCLKCWPIRCPLMSYNIQGTPYLSPLVLFSESVSLVQNCIFYLVRLT